MSDTNPFNIANIPVTPAPTVPALPDAHPSVIERLLSLEQKAAQFFAPVEAGVSTFEERVAQAEATITVIENTVNAIMGRLGNLEVSHFGAVQNPPAGE